MQTFTNAARNTLVDELDIPADMRAAFDKATYNASRNLWSVDLTDDQLGTALHLLRANNRKQGPWGDAQDASRTS
ncbi:hypothetical protein [Streptomyces catenulae]|uniref:Uncharacterized protein n=1 Tax=Streptomyces catenulae TaxID=66875 RepID=A0ABV2YXM8_9ACTN|nr:hypothetical protein [Streptomyces catenulae]